MSVIFAYFSPETLLPATSIIATALGFFMLVGRGAVRLMIRGWRVAATRSPQIASTSEPHYPHPHAAETHAADAYVHSGESAVQSMVAEATSVIR